MPPKTVVVLSCLLLPVNALALRCGTALISKGDSQVKVLRYCGEPAQVSRHYGLRTGFTTGKRLSSNNSSAISSGTNYYLPYGRHEVLVEKWIINLGPNRLMRLVSFEDGIVVEVDTLEYGYHE